MEDQAIERLEQLVRRVAEPGQRSAATTLVNRWFDEHPERYVEGVLSAELGSHHGQYAAYELLTCDRRVALHRRAVARCRAEDLGGLTAGAFMIGRFVCTSQAVAFWSQLEDAEVAFILDQWVLHGRYLKVLDQVGERKIRRARRLIEEGRLAEIRVTRGDAMVFIPLKLSTRDLDRVAEHAARAVPQTLRLLTILRLPYGELFDFDVPWSVGRLQQLCDEATLSLPRPDEV